MKLHNLIDYLQYLRQLHGGDVEVLVMDSDYGIDRIMGVSFGETGDAGDGFLPDKAVIICQERYEDLDV